MELSKHQRSPVPGPQTFEAMIAFLTDPEAVKGHLAQLTKATEELREATEEHGRAVAQIVEAEKIVQAVQAAQQDRVKAHDALEEAQVEARDVVLKATAEATQLTSDATRTAIESAETITEAKAALDTRETALAQREESEGEKAAEAEALMTEAQGAHQLATKLREDVEAKARRMAQAAQS